MTYISLCVNLSEHKDFWAKGPLHGGRREVRECSGVFIISNMKARSMDQIGKRPKLTQDCTDQPKNGNGHLQALGPLVIN